MQKDQEWGKTWKVLVSTFFIITSVSLARGQQSGDKHCPEGENQKRPDSLDQTKTQVEAIQRNVDTITSDIKACNDPAINLRTVLVGFKCKTSKGGVFERVFRPSFGEAWRDPDGMVWSFYTGTYGYNGARASCRRINGSLPTLTHFENAEANGIREVVGFSRERWYWSSTSPDSVGRSIHVFFGSDGRTHYYGRNSTEGSVHCVRR